MKHYYHYICLNVDNTYCICVLICTKLSQLFHLSVVVPVSGRFLFLSVLYNRQEISECLSKTLNQYYAYNVKRFKSLEPNDIKSCISKQKLI